LYIIYLYIIASGNESIIDLFDHWRNSLSDFEIRVKNAIIHQLNLDQASRLLKFDNIMGTSLRKLAVYIGIFIAAIAIYFPEPAAAATYTWDGGGGDENWSTCANWSSDTCPLTTDSVIFSASSTKNADIDADLTIVGITINSGYTGLISPLASQTILVNGVFTQGAGTFTASAATTTIRGGFTYTAGTFNHNSGTVSFLNGGSNITVTTGAIAFNNVVFDYTGASLSRTTSLASDITIGGNLIMLTTNTLNGPLTVQSSVSGTSRTLTVGGNFLFPSTSGGTNGTFGGPGTFNLIVNLSGNLIMSDGDMSLSADVTFASSSTQTITRSAGTIDSSSDWYDTGSGDLALSANFTGSQMLRPDTDTDFNFIPTAFTFSSTGATVATSTSFTPNGPSSYIFTSLSHYGGTFNATASTTINAFSQIGGIFNATPNSTTTVSGSFTHTSGTFNHNSGTMSFFSTADTTITPGAAVFNNVFFDYGGSAISRTASIAGDMTINGNLIVQNSNSLNGPLTVQSSVSGTARTLTVAGDLIFPTTSGSTVIILGGATTFNIIVNLTGNLNLADSSATLNADVNLTGASTQTITKSAGSVATHSDWTINKSSGQALLTTALVSSGTVNVATGTLRTAGFTLTTASSGLTVGGGGNLQIQGGETISTSTFATSSTMTYDGTAGPYTLKNFSYKNLTIQGLGATFNMPGSLDINGNLNIASGTLDIANNAYTLNVDGNWSNTGTFTPRSGTVTLDGVAQNVNGTTTFYNLTKTVSASSSLIFAFSTTQTVSNVWTANGALGQLLYLRSSSPGTRWSIDPQGTRALSYIDVMDSNNANATIITTSANMVDSGNNLNWGFDLVAPASSGVIVTTSTSTASILWSTDEPAYSRVVYGLTASYGSMTSLTGTASTTQTAALSGLTPVTTYHYALIATDSSGNTSTTTDATFTTDAIPDVTAPTVALLTPADASYASSTVSITATSSDAIGVSGVQFKVDGSNQGAEDTGAPYSVSWNTTLIADGAHTLLAVARDAAGNYATSTPFTINIDNTAAVRSGGSPSSALPQGTTSTNITLNTDENATCRYGTVAGTAYASLPNAFTTTGGTSHSKSIVGLVDGGTYAYYVRCTDSHGVINSTDYGISFSVTSDGNAPTVSITAPTNNEIVSGSAVAVTADATDDVAVSGVQFTLDGASLQAEDTVSAYGIIWDTTATADGSHVLTAIARDSSGNYATSSSITVTVRNAPATPVTPPIYGATQKSYPTEPFFWPIQNPQIIHGPEQGFFPAFVNNLQAGRVDLRVRDLQRFLNARGFAVARIGAGSPGRETTTFGPATKAAVIRFQRAFGIQPAVGFFGPLTRAKVNELMR
jgi:hypothetical protein